MFQNLLDLKLGGKIDSIKPDPFHVMSEKF